MTDPIAEKPPTNFHVYSMTSATACNSNRMTLDQNAQGVIESGTDSVAITVDAAGSNTLVMAGGTLRVGGNGRIKVFTQSHNGVGVMQMTGGTVEAKQLRVAASWNSSEAVSGRGVFQMFGGLMTLSDGIIIGADSGTHGSADVYFGGGRIVAPNGIRMTYNDTDRVVFDGTVFEATQERANYFNFAKATSSNVVVAEGGLILDDKGFNLGLDLGKIGGDGVLVKRGTGVLTLTELAEWS